MEKIIIEVGSTVTKIDKYDGNKVTRLDEITIFFKQNYNEESKIKESDFTKLVDIINELKIKYPDIYVCGTSIFRTLSNQEREEFLDKFKNATGYDFNIISQEKEGELTVIGAAGNIKEKVCVFIGGGGSTEIVTFDNKITETVNTDIGVMDVMKKFPDLGNDLATTSLEEVKEYIKENLNIPKEKSDILILAGGAHEKFARNSGVKYESNNLYNDNLAPIMMDIETRINETERYYKEISLDAIREKSSDPDWWYATRAMCAFVLVVAEAIEARYIVPTDIGMVYGILK